MDPDLRRKIVDHLRKLSEKTRDADTRAAFLLSRGLVRDRSAVPELIEIAASRSKDATLRGYCCVALGLIGEASSDVRAALKLALAERRSVDLRRDAATGLGLLRDHEAVDILLEELRKARSFAVQGQLITAIGTIGDQAAIPPLVEILDDRSQPTQTRAMAAVGLGMIGDLRDVPALARLSKDYNYRASVPDLDELLFIL
jgi:HEAT repeat protein